MAHDRIGLVNTGINSLVAEPEVFAFSRHAGDSVLKAIESQMYT